MTNYYLCYDVELDEKARGEVIRLTKANDLREPAETQGHLIRFEPVVHFALCQSGQKAWIYFLEGAHQLTMLALSSRKPLAAIEDELENIRTMETLSSLHECWTEFVDNLNNFANSYQILIDVIDNSFEVEGEHPDVANNQFLRETYALEKKIVLDGCHLGIKDMNALL